MSEKENITTENTTTVVDQELKQSNNFNVIHSFFVILLSVGAGIFVASWFTIGHFGRDLFLDYPHSNKNAVAYVTGDMWQQIINGVVGFLIGATVAHIIAFLCNLSVKRELSGVKLETYKKHMGVTSRILMILLPATVLATCFWLYNKNSIAQEFNSSTAASCFKISDEASFIDNQCALNNKVVIADSMFAYSDSQTVVKQVDGKYVEGIEYTVDDRGKNYGVNYHVGEKVFIPKSDLGEQDNKWDEATYDLERWWYSNIEDHYLKKDILDGDSKYVLHMIKKEHKSFVGESSIPNWVSPDGVKLNIEGNEYYFKKSKQPTIKIQESEPSVLPLMVRSEIVK